MGLTGSVVVQLGAEAGSFKTTFEDAAKSVKGVHRQFKEFKELLELGGVGLLAERMFDAIAEHAAKSKDPLSENATAVRELRETLTGAKNATLDFGVATVGLSANFGAFVGDGISHLAAFAHGFGDLAHTESASWTHAMEILLKHNDALMAADIAVEDTRDSLRQVVANYLEVKKHADEFGAITKEIAEAEKQAAAFAFSRLTPEERMTVLQIQYLDLQTKIAVSANSALERRRAELELKRTGLEIDKQAATNADAASKASIERRKADDAAELSKLSNVEKVKKLTADLAFIEESLPLFKKGSAEADAKITEQKEKQKMLADLIAKSAEEERTRQADFNRKAQLEQAIALEMFELERKAKDHLTEQEHDRLKLLRLMTDEKRIHVQIEELLAKGIANLTPQEKIRLDLLIHQDAALVNQITHQTQLAGAVGATATAQHAITAELQEQLELLQKQALQQTLASQDRTYEFNGVSINSARPSSFFQNLSPGVLQELIRRNQTLIDQLEATKYTSASSGAEAASGFLHRGQAEAALLTEIQRAQFVLNQNSSLKGVDYQSALQSYKGDLSLFDSLYQAANTSNPQLTKLSNGVDQLNQRLEVVGFGLTPKGKT